MSIVENAPYAPMEDAELEQAQEVIGYAEYREFCDANSDSFRRVGLLSERAYEAAVSDPETVSTEIEGRIMPVLAPLGYEERYSAQRTQELTGKADVSLLTIPAASFANLSPEATDDIREKLAGKDIAVIIEQFGEKGTEQYESLRDSIIDTLESAGQFEPGEFIHEELKEIPGHESAWMAMYGFSIETAAPETEKEGPVTGGDIIRAWDEYRNEQGLPEVPADDAEGTYLLTSQQLRENPKIIDDLWAISEVGFGKVLGAYHPISMEVTKQSFDEHISGDGILVAARYHEGEPVCFGFLAMDLDHNDWIDVNSSVLQEDARQAEERGEIPVHFFELISNGQRGMGYSPDILQLFFDLAGRTGGQYRVYFESTNLSALYIPVIAQQQVEASPSVHMTQQVAELDKLNYWYASTSK